MIAVIIGDFLRRKEQLCQLFGAFMVNHRQNLVTSFHHRHAPRNNHLALADAVADLTAHVDFSALARAGTEAGLDLTGYASQANFLLNAGLTELLMQTPPTDAAAYLPQANAVQRLVSPAEMGELFKVIGFVRGSVTPLAGFARGDRRHCL